MQCIVILLNELFRVVANGASEMTHQKTLLIAQRAMRFKARGARQSKAIMVRPRLVHLRGEVRGRGLGQFGLLVQQCKNAIRLGLDQLNDVLIVREGDLRHIEALALIQLLFILQNVVVKELLQLLVAVVDAKLFKRVDREILKASNIQDTNVKVRCLEGNALIDQSHNPIEEATVNGLGQGIACVARLVDLQRNPKNET